MTSDELSRTGAEHELPLSPQQQAMLMTYLRKPDNEAYHVSATVRYERLLDVAHVSESLAVVTAKHDMLRAYYPDGAGALTQVVADDFAPDVHVASSPDRQFTRRLARSFVRSRFPLDLAPPFRALVITEQDRASLVVLVFHHIAVDGRSRDVLVREFCAAMQSVEHDGALGTSATADYASFIERSRSDAAVAARSENLAYWRRTLAGAVRLPLTEAENGAEAPGEDDVASYGFTLTTACSARLKSLAFRRRVSVTACLAACYAAGLRQATGERDVLLGLILSGRGDVRFSRTVGHFVNTVPLRVILDDSESVDMLVQRVNRAVVEAAQHQDVSLLDIAAHLSQQNVASGGTAFGAGLAFDGEIDDAQSDEPLPSGAMVVRGRREALRFDVQMHGEVHSGSLRVVVSFRSTALSRAAALALGSTFRAAMAELLGVREVELGEFVGTAAPTPQDSRREAAGTAQSTAGASLTVTGWHRWVRPATSPTYATLSALFDEQVAATPDAPALISGGDRLTYRDLAARVAWCAAWLRHRGIGPEVTVGIMFERSVEMIVTLLGVLRAGGAYLPLDPAYPGQRLGYMIADARPAMIVTTEQLRARVPDDVAVAVLPGRLSGHGPVARTETALADSGGVHSAAAVIYTSGSTGDPKAVVLSHEGFAALAASQRETFGVGPGKVVVQFFSLNFDAALWEIVLTLTSGGALVVAPEEELHEPSRLARLVRTHAVTHLACTPSFLDAVPVELFPPNLTITIGGEPSTPALVSRWSRDHRVINLYGPAEVTICASTSRPLVVGEAPTIGTAITGKVLHVLGPALQPVGPGEVGELYVGGVGLARGYLRRPGLTAERFIASPVGTGDRLYRTGDLVRRRLDGTLLFVGRVDDQVKVNGIRVEPAEVEAALCSFDAVVRAAVVLEQDGQGGGYLAGHVVPGPEQTVDLDALRSHVARILPRALVPSALGVVTTLPLTPNGKLDRRALPSLSPARGSTGAPPIERRASGALALIAHLLGRSSVSPHDNFFDLGGHSLLAIRLTQKLNEEFGVSLKLRQVFDAPTVGDMLDGHLEVWEWAVSTSRACLMTRRPAS